MKIVANTYNTAFKKENGQPDTISVGDYKKVLINWIKLPMVNRVFIKYQRHTLHSDISEKDLTELAAEMSTSSFAEIWEEEEDEYWSSYLEV